MWFISFFKGYAGIYVVTSRQALSYNYNFVITPHLVSLFGAFVRFSVGAYKTWLSEHGGYELNLSSFNSSTEFSLTTVMWYSFFSTAGYRFTLYILSLRNKASQSLERMFRNARWLEKESAEMHDWFFLSKRDRRALFLMPLLYFAPLKKTFPVSGFFELRLNPKDGSLYPTHISWLD